LKIFEKSIVVSKNDLDKLNHVNNIVYINWIINIARNHWETLVSNEILDNYYWVLLEHNIKYLNPSFLNDKIQIKTFIEKNEGFRSIRVVEFYNYYTNKLLVVSKSTWCLISLKNNKPSRIPMEIIKAFT